MSEAGAVVKARLTERQRLVLDAIHAHMLEHRRPPTLREIGSRVGIKSTNGVNDHLRALERKGWISRDAYKSRGLRVVGAVSAARVQERIRDIARDLEGASDNGDEAWLRKQAREAWQSLYALAYSIGDGRGRL